MDLDLFLCRKAIMSNPESLSRPIDFATRRGGQQKLM
jgi:hypothetical protein